MGSELVSGLLEEPVRGVLGGDDEDDGLRDGGVAGAIVSPSASCSSPMNVVPVSGSAASPQEEQNLAVAGTFAPHFGQNMGERDSITGPRLAVSG
jgi:hypothetical protein